MESIDHAAHRPWWRSPFGVVFCGFAAIAAFFLITEHTAHVFGALPFLFLLACPLMHLFMHHGHGANHDGEDSSKTDQGGDHA